MAMRMKHADAADDHHHPDSHGVSGGSLRAKKEPEKQAFAAN